MDIAKHHQLICILCHAWVTGSLPLFTPTTASSQWRLCQLRESCYGGDGGEANSCNFQRRRSSLLPVLSLGGGFSFAVDNNRWPRWQPLNDADAMPYWWDASRRVSLQAALVIAAYSCDWTTAALVFQLGDSWRQQLRSGFGFRWILKLCYFVLYSAFFYLFCLFLCLTILYI
jgi:hypothetical protein